MSSRNKILFVMEGLSPDKRLLKRFIDAFSKEMQIDGSQVIAVYGTNIYTLYSELKSLQAEEHEFGDIVEVVRSHNPRELEGFSRNDFSDVYLFFDLDIHGRDVKKACSEISAMISWFDNETENGKIFVSYPMVESVYLCDKEELLFKSDRCFVALSDCLNDGFKKMRNRICHGNDTTIPVDGIENIKAICSANFKKANWLLFDDKSLPSSVESFTQGIIWGKQELSIIDKFQVATLSGLPFFVGEYLGSSKMLDALDN